MYSQLFSHKNISGKLKKSHQDLSLRFYQVILETFFYHISKDKTLAGIYEIIKRKISLNSRYL